MLPSFELLTTLALRSAALLAIAWLGAQLMQRMSPGLRQVLWTSVVAGVLVLPLLTAVLPAWQVLPAMPWAADRVMEPITGPAPAFDLSVASGVESADSIAPAGSEGRRHLSWSERAVVVWIAGGLLLGLTFSVGLLRLRSVSQSARPASRSLSRHVRELAVLLSVRRPVRVLVSSQLGSPATWGIWRPRIVVPEAALGWSDERCRLVLAHELVHIARGDWAWRLLAQVGCVFYWFNPLVWLAARRLRLEQELACDQAVVDLGARPSTYAHHLLNIARAATRRRALPLVALDMARRSQMEGRLMSILSDRPSRTLRRGLLLPALSVVVALPLVAAAQPKAPEAPAAPAPEPVVAPTPVAIEGAVPMPDPSPAPVAAVAPTPPGPPAVLAPAVAPSVVISPQVAAVAVAPRPELAMSGVPVAPSPVLAPRASVSVAPVVIAQVAPVDEAEAEAMEQSWVWDERNVSEREIELEEQISTKAEEISELMEPLQEHIETVMEQDMEPIIREMEAVELDMRPIQEEMSRIGEELSQAVEASMAESGELEEMSRHAELLAEAMAERAELSRRALDAEGEERERLRQKVREMREQMEPRRLEMEEARKRLEATHHARAEEMRANLAPHRERMEQLRAEMEPDRERMEALREQMEPMRQEFERVREEHLSEIRAELEVLRTEMTALHQELQSERLRRHAEEE